MSNSPARRELRRRSIKRRAAAAPEGNQQCAVIGCRNLTQRAAGEGLSTAYCKPHKEMLRRHGSTWRQSFSASELGPYRKAASRWLKDNRQTLDIPITLKCLDILLAEAGEVETPDVVRWLKPKRKADVALARFREAGKAGSDLFTIALALEAITTITGPRDLEFRHVQIAKVVHRVSSGSYPVTSGGQKLRPSWPRSEGLVLRGLGKRVRDEARVFDIDGAVEFVIKEAAR